MKSETGQPVTRDDVQFPNVLVELWGPGATGRAFTNAKSEFTFVTDIYGTTSIVAIADFPLGGGTTKTFSIGSKLTQLFHGETNTFENLDIFVDVHQFRGSVFFAQRDGTSIPIESGATEWNTEHTEMSSISEQDAKSTEVSFFLSFFLSCQ
ncbi:MAG: hypothetical protein GY822_02465 [Deltaproteobacteria bacterium]|nr:hypothetical protein [Deltaproteobacteria bacterium]